MFQLTEKQYFLDTMKTVPVLWYTMLNQIKFYQSFISRILIRIIINMPIKSMMRKTIYVNRFR